MALAKAKKIILIIGVSLLVIQVPWFLVTQLIVDRSQVKTTATVIGVETADAGCTADRLGKPDPTCDHSPREYPVYEYYDESGKRHIQDDRFFGEYKRNNPLRHLFGKYTGDKVTAYYTKGKPQEVMFMAGPFAYAVWLIPLVIAMHVFAVLVILSIIHRLKKK